MSSQTVLVTCRQMQVELPLHLERLESAGFTVLAPDLGSRQSFASDELAAWADGCVGVIAGDDEIDRAFFERFADLQVLIRWGIGVDNVDHGAAADHGVSVRNTPGVFGDEVADSAMGYLLNLARGYIDVDREVRDGEWPKYEGFTLAGSRLGVVGLGAIGRAILRRGHGFGMELVGFDPGEIPDAEVPYERVSVKALMESSDVIVLACPLTPTTHHLINARTLAKVKHGVYVVNVARGPVVDEAALADALASGVVAGAGLDVFEVEPLPDSSPLRSLPRVILGSHNGSNTRQGVARASAQAVDFLLEGLKK